MSKKRRKSVSFFFHYLQNIFKQFLDAAGGMDHLLIIWDRVIFVIKEKMLYILGRKVLEKHKIVIGFALLVFIVS